MSWFTWSCPEISTFPPFDSSRIVQWVLWRCPVSSVQWSEVGWSTRVMADADRPRCRGARRRSQARRPHRLVDGEQGVERGRVGVTRARHLAEDVWQTTEEDGRASVSTPHLADERRLVLLHRRTTHVDEPLLFISISNRQNATWPRWEYRPCYILAELVASLDGPSDYSTHVFAGKFPLPELLDSLRKF